jgi:uncharacterized protein involved in exopolysaccharide biosynthesis
MDSSISKATVNFEQVIIVLIKWWWLLVAVLTLSISLGFAYIKMADKQYTVRTVFFIPGSPRNSFLNYSALINGSGATDDIRPYIDSIVKSRRMQIAIGKSLQPQFPTHSIEVLLSKDLKLSKKLRLSSDQKTGIFILNYTHTTPKTAALVITSCLANLNQINRELEVSPKTKIMTIIDYPEIPKYPSWPNYRRVIVIAFLSGIFLGVTLVFLIEFIIYLRKRFKEKPFNEYYLCN